MIFWRAVVALSTFLLSSCSLGGGMVGRNQEEVKALEYLTEVSEVAWQWEAPKDTSRVEIFPVPGGVAVLLADGVVALSGENGGQMWEFRVSGSETFGSLAGGGRYFALQFLNPDDEGAPPRMVVLDIETGEPVHDYVLAEGDSSSGLVREGLRNITDEYWITVGDDELTAFTLGSDKKAWSVSNVAQCEETGSIDSLVTVEETTIAAVTCYEQPDDENTVKMTEGQEFVSGFVGIDPETGEELWRTKEQVGMFPADSLERGVGTHRSGLITSYYPYQEVGQVVDPLTGETKFLEEGRVLWMDEDGSLLGVWRNRTGDYWKQDFAGDIREGSPGGGSDISESFANALRGTTLMVGLEDGLLQFAKDVNSGEEASEIAIFQGFDRTVPLLFTRDRETSIEIRGAKSVPGAVAVSYTDAEERSGVIGLQ